MRTTIPKEKQTLRNQILALRNKLTPKEIGNRSLTISKKIFSLPEYKQAKAVLFFVSFGSEVLTQPLIKKTLLTGKSVIVPRVNRTKKELNLYQIKSLRELSPGSYGIPEPKPLPERLIKPEKIDLVILPGIVFDKKGARIGYGGGYYDRLLKKFSNPLRKPKNVPVYAGLAFDFQVLESIPQKSHDVSVDILVTEKCILRFKKKGVL